MHWEALGKLLIVGGIFVILLGIILIFVSKIPFLGNLPGDIVIDKGNMKIYIPLATCIILSIILTLLLNLLLRK